MSRLPISPAAVRKLLREIEGPGPGDHVLAVGGTSELAPVLRQQFLRGRAAPGAVRLGDPEGADVYVHVIAGEPHDEDVDVLRRAAKRRIPVIAVAIGFPRDIPTIPYVLATDVVWAGSGRSFPLETIARAIAGLLGEDGARLAARVPLLRQAVCEQLVAATARKNGVLAAAVWMPGADLPVLMLNELRLVLRLAQAHGVDGGRERLAELGATFGAGLGLRALARGLLDLVPPADAEGGRGLSAGRGRLDRPRFQRIPGWALKGAVAYGGTRVLGEAACLRFALVARQPQAAGARAEP